MAKVSINPKKECRIKIRLESSQRDPRLIFEVTSDIPVTTYFMDDMGLEDYENGKASSYYAGFKDRRNHLADLTLPGFKQYHLIVVNKSADRKAHIEYDIKAR